MGVLGMQAADNGRQQALTGITVLDLGQAFMGPYCGMLLQRLGADVVKVEPLQGEPYRRPTARKNTEPMQFGLLNAGKRNLTIDLKNAEFLQSFGDTSVAEAREDPGIAVTQHKRERHD